MEQCVGILCSLMLVLNNFYGENDMAKALSQKFVLKTVHEDQVNQLTNCKVDLKSLHVEFTGVSESRNSISNSFSVLSHKHEAISEKYNDLVTRCERITTNFELLSIDFATTSNK